MQVILLERIETLGQMGDVVDVKPGYARNFLMPKGKAMRATKENLEAFEQRRTQLEATNLEKRSEAQTLAERLDGFSCVLLRQASDSAQLYGSVTARDIAEAITDGGVTVHRTQVMLDRPIKMLGIHAVRVALHPEVIINVEINVARSAEEAEATAEAAARGEVPPIFGEAGAIAMAEQATAEDVASAVAGSGEPDVSEIAADETAHDSDVEHDGGIGDQDSAEAGRKD